MKELTDNIATIADIATIAKASHRVGSRRHNIVTIAKASHREGAHR